MNMDQSLLTPRSTIVAALLLLWAALALRCLPFLNLHDSDMELFVYMGKLVSQGGIIGVDLFDNKLPTVGLLMQWPYAVFGANWAGYASMSVGLYVVTVLALARAAGRVHKTSTWPTAVMAGAWMCLPMVVSSPFKLEHVQVCFAAIGAWAAVRCLTGSGHARHAFVLGLCAGIAAMAKPSGGAVMLAGGVAMLFAKHIDVRTRLRLACAAMAGLCFPLAYVGLYLLKPGAWEGLLMCVSQVRAYSAGAVWVGSELMIKLLSAGAVLGVPLLLRGWGERRAAVALPTHARAVVLFASLWLSLEVVAVVLQGRLYAYHFLTIFAPASLAFGLLLRRPRWGMLLMGAAPVLALGVWMGTSQVAHPVERLRAIDYVREHAAPGDGVWMDDIGRILVETDLRPGSRLPLTFVFTNDDTAPTRFAKVLIDDIESRRPRWLVYPADVEKWVGFLRAHQFELAGSVARGDRLLTAWRDIDHVVQQHYVMRAQFGRLVVLERKK